MSTASFLSPGRILALLLATAALLCPMACSMDDLEQLRALQGKTFPAGDLDLAEAALKDRDIGDAEMYFERYLRKNPTGRERWDVWHELLDISLNMRQDKAIARDYLEIMLVEYYDDPSKRRDIQIRLAAICNDMRLYGRATALWEELTADPDLPLVQRATIYRELSRAYLRRLEIAKATAMLDQCLQLDVAEDVKAACLYELAETQMLTDDLKASEESLNKLLLMDELSPERRVVVTFMLADVLEQQSRIDEALRYYESIRENYPNNKVVEIRLNSLRNRKNAKKQPDVVPKRR